MLIRRPISTAGGQPQLQQRRQQRGGEDDDGQFPDPLVFERAGKRDQGRVPLLAGQAQPEQRAGCGQGEQHQPGDAERERCAERVAPPPPQQGAAARALGDLTGPHGRHAPGTARIPGIPASWRLGREGRWGTMSDISDQYVKARRAFQDHGQGHGWDHGRRRVVRDCCITHTDAARHPTRRTPVAATGPARLYPGPYAADVAQW